METVLNFYLLVLMNFELLQNFHGDKKLKIGQSE